ncbi:MAG: prepilin-type N-terminal cleavage/methylation domain-containing protein [Planctomycetota bacterium]|jgi:prepilin-type N-terminal cleavage/methylation domain-containing protein
MFIQWIKSFSIKTGKVRSEKGFTLLELILVLVVVSIIASALAMPFLSNLNEGTKPDIYSTATQFATADIESLRADGFGAIVVTNGVPTATANSPTTINGRSYTRTISTAYADADFSAINNTFNTINPVTNDYIMVVAVVTETTIVPNTSVTLTSVITPDYN